MHSWVQNQQWMSTARCGLKSLPKKSFFHRFLLHHRLLYWEEAWGLLPRECLSFSLLTFGMIRSRLAYLLIAGQGLEVENRTVSPGLTFSSLVFCRAGQGSWANLFVLASLCLFPGARGWEMGAPPVETHCDGTFKETLVLFMPVRLQQGRGKKLKLMAETELVWPLPRARTQLLRTLTFSLALVWLWFCLQNLLLGSYLIDWEQLYCSILCGPCGRLRNLKGSLRKGREKGLSKQVSRNQVWVCEPLSGVKTKSLKINPKEQTHFHIIFISIFVTFITALRPIDLFLGTLILGLGILISPKSGNHWNSLAVHLAMHAGKIDSGS